MSGTSTLRHRLSRFFPWPQKLLGQMIVLLLLALLLAQGISLWILSNAHRKAVEGYSQRFWLRQLSSMVVLLESTPRDLHPAVLNAWKRPGIRIQRLAESTIDLADQAVEKRLAGQLVRWLGDNYRDRVRVDVTIGKPPPPPDNHIRHWGEPGVPNHRPRHLRLEELAVAIQLQDGSWLQTRALAPITAPLAARQTLIFLLVSGVLVLMVVIWRLRKITRPLNQLTLAADALGRGQKVDPLEVQGPEDIQATITAFNHMNERLDRFVSERTRMLAALSHDLRTPITIMRLRLEMMTGGEERDKLLASLDEMQQMSEATLAFIRESGDNEETRCVDLVALVSSLCEDLVDLGASITLKGDVFEDQRRESIAFACRPVSLKRALRNLIENAINYGQSATVGLEESSETLLIRIQDQGPGIPDAEMEKVFEPFYRLEASRSRETGGIGLGLSISRQIITNHGGDLRLQNTPEGLLAELTLPRK